MRTGRRCACFTRYGTSRCTRSTASISSATRSAWAAAPVVSLEAVLQEDPEAIFGTAEKNYGGVNLWRQYATMKAVRGDNLYTLDGNLLNRAGPRMIAGTAALCEKLEMARQHRKAP